MAKDLSFEWHKVLFGRIDQSSTKRDKEQDGGITKWLRAGLAKRCFCISCSKAAGFYLKDTTNIIYVCQSCFNTYGGLPLPEVHTEELNELVDDFDPNRITNLG